MRGGASLVINDSTCPLKYDFDIGPLIINFGNSVCTPRSLGGLGIIDLELQNTALLLRWWWRPNTDRGAIWSEFIIRIRTTSVRGVRRWNTGGSFFWKSVENSTIVQSVRI